MLETLGWANPPADLAKPSSRVMAGLGNNSPSVSAVVVAPNWIMTAAHVTHNGNTLKSQYVNKAVDIFVLDEENELKMYGLAAGDAVKRHPTLDISLIHVRNLDNSPANFSSVVTLANSDDVSAGGHMTLSSPLKTPTTAPPFLTLNCDLIDLSD